MPDDFTQAFLQSYAISSQRAERMAALRAQQSLQALQERRTAQEIELASQKIGQLKQQIADENRFRADAQTAHANFRFDQEILGAPPLQAAINNFGPLMAQKASTADDLMRGIVSMAELSDKQAQRAAAQNFQPSAQVDPATGVVFAEEAPGKFQAMPPRTNVSQALTTTAKDFAAYKTALDTDDKVAQEVFGRKLGIVGLQPEDRLVLSALIKSQLDSVDAMIDPDAAGAKIEKLIQAYTSRRGGASTSAPAPLAAPTPAPAPAAKRYNPATRKIE